MSKYKGPRVRQVRKLGKLPGLTNKVPQKSIIRTPGERGQELKEKLKKLLKNPPYGLRLFEKQKLRFNYNITERQLLRYVKQAKQLTGSTGELLLTILEMRLDNIVYRLGMAPTIVAARQLVSHGHILVNQQKITIPSYPCKLKEVISVKNKKTSQNLVTKFVEESFSKGFDRKKGSGWKRIPDHLSFNKTQLIGIIQRGVTRKWIGLKVNELFVIEYYSRN